MPYRAAGILMALAGLVAVVGLIIVGIDVYTAKERGPRWKRRLLGAGLAVLGMVGVWFARPRLQGPTCYLPVPSSFSAPSLQRLDKQSHLLYELTTQGRVDPEVAGKALAATEAALEEASSEQVLKGLSAEERAQAEGLRESARFQIEHLRRWIAAGPVADSTEWKSLVEAWHEAEEVLSGRSAARKDLLSRLHKASIDAVGFGQDGRLTWSEAGLLSLESQAQAERVRHFRSAGTGQAGSPGPTASLAAKRTAERLAERLPLLQKLSEQDRLLPGLTGMILSAIERDLAALSEEAMLATLGANRPEAEKTRDAVKAEVEKLKQSLNPTPKPAASLEESPDWKVIADAWDFAMPFARSGKSTEAQRKQIDDKLAAAREAASRLVKAGLLSAKEAELLNSEAEKAVKDIRHEPPIGVKCYMMDSLPISRLSLTSIKDRLPAIEALAKDGKVQPAAIGKVLEAIEADLATLADEKRRAELGDQTPKTEADKLRGELSARVTKLKALLLLQRLPPDRPMCYEIQMVPPPKPQSARELDERLAMLDALERGGQLSTPAAEKSRAALAAEKVKLLPGTADERR